MPSPLWNDASYLTATTFASGAFVLPQAPVVCGGCTLNPTPTTLFNPAPPPDDGVLAYDDISLQQARGELCRVFGNVRAEDIKPFTADDFKSYDKGMIEAAAELRKHRPMFILVPMRGGQKPKQIIDAMLNHEFTFVSFPFTHKTEPIRAAQYLDDLHGILASLCIRHHHDLRFAVLDAGMGGDSTNILAKWIARLHKELGGVWRVQMHVFHTPEWPPQPFRAAERKSGKGLRVDVRNHLVSHLLVEDWEAGLALKAEFDGEVVAYKPSIRPGAVFISWSNGQSVLLGSEDASLAVTKAISRLGAELMHETLKREPSLDSQGSYYKTFGPG